MFKTLLAGVSLFALFAGTVLPAQAVEERNTAPGLSAVGAPVGLHGTDPVALLTTGKHAGGTAKFTDVSEAVAFYFTSQANLDTFKANPAKFTPQNGGFCTYGVSVGKKFDGDPRYAAVVDGKLYVFLNGNCPGFLLYRLGRATHHRSSDASDHPLCPRRIWRCRSDG
jgi:YHS domain-containing protein